MRGLLGLRSFYLTGCFINVIKHRQALWFCIIADLHSREKKGVRKRRERSKRRKEGEKLGLCRESKGRENKDMRLAGEAKMKLERTELSKGDKKR